MTGVKLEVEKLNPGVQPRLIRLVPRLPSGKAIPVAEAVCELT